jgi:hypothetical protein
MTTLVEVGVNETARGDRSDELEEVRLRLRASFQVVPARSSSMFW